MSYNERTIMPLFASFLDWYRALPPAGVGAALLCLLLLGACWGWAHSQTVLTEQLLLSQKHTHYWKLQAQLRPPTLAESALLASEALPRVRPSSPRDWRDSGLLTQIDIQRAPTLVWHKPPGASAVWIKPIARRPPPLPRAPSGHYMRRKSRAL